MSYNLNAAGVPDLFIACEMSFQEIAQRMMARAPSVPPNPGHHPRLLAARRGASSATTHKAMHQDAVAQWLADVARSGRYLGHRHGPAEPGRQHPRRGLPAIRQPKIATGCHCGSACSWTDDPFVTSLRHFMKWSSGMHNRLVWPAIASSSKPSGHPLQCGGIVFS